MHEIFHVWKKINLNVVLLCLCGPLLVLPVNGAIFFSPSLVVWKVAFPAFLPTCLA